MKDSQLDTSSIDFLLETLELDGMLLATGPGIAAGASMTQIICGWCP